MSKTNEDLLSDIEDIIYNISDRQDSIDTYISKIKDLNNEIADFCDKAMTLAQARQEE